MRFRTHDGVDFEIPDDWWAFAEMGGFHRNGARCYSVAPKDNVELVALTSIQTPARDPGIEPFKKYKLVPVLFGFSAKHSLPPVEVTDVGVATGYQYRVQDGFHRYYASVAAGFPFLPVIDINKALLTEESGPSR
jgi:hypothetical protein